MGEGCCGEASSHAREGDQDPAEDAHRPGPAGRHRQQSLDCLHYRAFWGAGDPEIREGVLRLVSTIPEVTVADSTTGGQPTLTITAGPALLGGDGEQVLTISARTGIPVSSVVTGRGMRTSVETFQISRVTLADIEAGTF